MKRYLTGRYYFKPTWRGLVLMIEHKIPLDTPGEWEKKWSKARQCDLPYLDIEIKSL
jgi:hypothetical protein